MSTASPLLSPELLARLETMELVSRKIFRGRMKGERRSRRKGQSVEFADFRNYVPGDDLRFIDWNSYARLDRLFLKMFMEEEDLHVYVLLDVSGSMDFGEPTKFDYARQLAAALGFIGLVRGDRVKIETLDAGGNASSDSVEPTQALRPMQQSSPVFRGRRSLWRMLDYLGGLSPQEGGQITSLAEGTKSFCVRNSGKGIVLLVSDLMDKAGYEGALRYLLAQDMDVYVVHVLSAEEMEPELAGDLRLVDCEDGDEAEITVNAPVLARYRRTLAAFIDSAREFCTRRGIAYILARNDLPVDQLVTGYLRRRGLVR